MPLRPHIYRDGIQTTSRGILTLSVSGFHKRGESSSRAMNILCANGNLDVLFARIENDHKS